MTAPPRPTVRDAAIAALLDKGLSVDRVAEIGVYRGTRTAPAWTRDDVERLAAPRRQVKPQPPEKPQRAKTKPPKPSATPWEPPPAPDEPPVVTLTARQGEVFDLLCEGLSGPEIAARLGTSEETVRTLSKRTRIALGARNGVHAVVLALSGQVVVKVAEKRAAS
jgi:DNA-binding CsgD family transcriptional regulator